VGDTNKQRGYVLTGHDETTGIDYFSYADVLKNILLTLCNQSTRLAGDRDDTEKFTEVASKFNSLVNATQAQLVEPIQNLRKFIEKPKGKGTGPTNVTQKTYDTPHLNSSKGLLNRKSPLHR